MAVYSIHRFRYEFNYFMSSHLYGLHHSTPQVKLFELRRSYLCKYKCSIFFGLEYKSLPLSYCHLTDHFCNHKHKMFSFLFWKKHTSNTLKNGLCNRWVTINFYFYKVVWAILLLGSGHYLSERGGGDWKNFLDFYLKIKWSPPPHSLFPSKKILTHPCVIFNNSKRIFKIKI